MTNSPRIESWSSDSARKLVGLVLKAGTCGDGDTPLPLAMGSAGGEYVGGGWYSK